MASVHGLLMVSGPRSAGSEPSPLASHRTGQVTCPIMSVGGLPEVREPRCSLLVLGCWLAALLVAAASVVRPDTPSLFAPPASRRALHEQGTAVWRRGRGRLRR